MLLRLSAVLLVLLLTTGVCRGMMYPLSYQYRYSGTVATGLPDVGCQRAAAAIQMTVVVDTIRSSEATVRFKDTRVGQYHGDSHCGDVTPTHMHRLQPAVREFFHNPFQINFRYHWQPIMQVPSEEPLWMTNIRKSVVSLLRVIPSTEHYIMRSLTNQPTNSFVNHRRKGPLQPKSFGNREDTMYGSCQVQYTLTPAPPSAREHLQVLHVDIQTRAGTTPEGRWPKVSDHLYYLQRSVDLENCVDQPVQVYTTNSEDIGKNTTRGLYGDFISQSSFGRFLLRGEDNPREGYNVRLERAEMESGIEMKPLGATGAMIMVMTNQTLQLELTKYNRRRSKVKLNLTPVKTMKFEMVSPFSSPASQDSDWIRYEQKNDSFHPVYPEYYSAGIVQNVSTTARLESKLQNECAEAARILQTSMASHSSSTGSKAHRTVPSGASVIPEVAEHLTSISSIIRSLPKHSLEELIRNLKKVKGNDLIRQVFHEGLTACGSSSAMSVLLTEILNQQMAPVRAYATLSTLVNGMRSPTSVLQLFNFAKQLSERIKQHSHQSTVTKHTQQALLTVAILGTSATFRRVCKTTHRSYYGAEYDRACHIEQDFLHFVQETIKETPSTPEKASLVHAVGYLESEAAHEFVIQLATSTSTHTMIRTAAIFSLMPQHTLSGFREQVLSSLQPVLESQVESPEVRQVAMMTLLAWRPSETWWLRIARASWREDSKAVAEFVFTATTAIASLSSEAWQQQSAHARRALPLVRPVMAPSRQSFLKIIESFLPAPLMESETKLGWILNLKSMLPEELFLTLSTRMNGVKMPLIEAFFIGDDLLSFWQKMHLLGIPPLPSLRGTSSQARLQREFNNILHVLGAPTPDRSPAEGLLLVRLFSDMHHSLPLHLDALQQTLAPILQSKVNAEAAVEFVKYLDPVQREVVVPSEMGLPIITKIHTPAVFYQKGKYKFTTNEFMTEANKNKRGQHSTSRFDMDMSFSGNTSISGALETTSEVLVPWSDLSLTAGMQLQGAVRVVNTTVGLKTHKDMRWSDLQLYTNTRLNKKVPVAVTRVVPFTVSRNIGPGDDLAGCRILHKLKEVHPLHSNTHKKSYHLPTPIPGFSGHVTYEEEGDVHHALPYNPWAYFFPTSRSVTPLRRQEVTLYLESESSTANSAELTLAAVRSANVQRGNNPRGDFVSLDVGSSRDARARVLDQFTGPGGWLVSADLQLSADQAQHKINFVHMTSAPDKSDGDHIRERYQTKLTSSGLSRDMNLEVQSVVRRPLLPAMDRLDRLLHSPLTAGATITLNSGHQEVASVKVGLSISEQELAMLGRRLPVECNFDRVDPTTSLRRAAYYDAAQIELTWKQDLPLSLLNTSYHGGTALRLLLLPHTDSNCIHVSSPERHIFVNVTRSLETRRATGWVRRPGCLEYVEEVPVPEVMDMLLPLHGHLTLSDMQLTEVDGHQATDTAGTVPGGDQCYVLPQRVVTFDKLEYDMDPPLCDRLVLHHVDGVDSLMVLTKQLSTGVPGQQQYRILLPGAAIDLLVQAATVKINGALMQETEKLLTDSANTVIVKISRTEDSISIYLPGRIKLLIKDGNKLMIQALSPELKGTVGGLCGDYDGESQEDLRDPRGCLHRPSSGILYATSWTIQPCSHSSSSVIQQVKEHQWDCPATYADLALPASGTYNPRRCRESVHRVLEDGGQLCITTTAITVCRPHCKPLTGTDVNTMIEVKCWSDPHVPPTVQEAKAVGYLHHLDPTPGALLPTHITYPQECIPDRD